MKALYQIITYLQNCGELSKNQIEYLEAQGYFNPYWEQTQESSVDSYDNSDFEPDLTDDFEAKEKGKIKKSRKNHSGKGKNTVSRGKFMTTKDFVDRLTRNIEEWKPELEIIHKVANKLSDKSTPEKAMGIIRSSLQIELEELFVDSLTNQTFSLVDLWTALKFNKYWYPIIDEKVFGEVITAYRLMLNNPNHSQLGKYSWILKEDSISWVYDLIQVQWSFIRAIKQIYYSQPNLLLKEVARTYHHCPASYWTYVILHNIELLNKNKKLIYAKIDDVYYFYWYNPFYLEHQNKYTDYLISLSSLSLPILGDFPPNAKNFIRLRSEESKKSSYKSYSLYYDDWLIAWHNALIYDRNNVKPFWDIFFSFWEYPRENDIIFQYEEITVDKQYYS